mgnify:CR=1 FL=1
MKNTSIESVNLNAFRVLEAIYEEGSASRAAVRLDMTQSGVSAALAQLRRVYHDPLFARTGRGLRPTLFCEQIMPFVSEALNQARKSFELYSGRKGLFEGRTITVGMSDDFEIALGAQLVEMARTLMPGGRLRFRQTNSQFVTDMLVAREIDLAITAGGISSDLLQHELVGSGTYACLVDPETYRASFDLENYVAHEHILVSYGGFFGVVDEVLGRRGVRRIIRVSTSHFAAVPYLLKGTDSIITMPRHAARAIAEVTALQFHECPIAYPVYSVELGFRRTAERDPLLRRLIVTLRERLAALL